MDLLDLESTTMLPIGDIERHMAENGPDHVPLYFTVPPKSERSLKAIWQTLAHLLGHHHLQYPDISAAYSAQHGSKWGLKIVVESTIPQGKGLGSSGSFSVALSAALLQYLSPRAAPSRDRIKEEALKMESIFHGKTSGIDVDVAVHGGTRAFKDGHSKAVPNPSSGFNVVLVDTNIPRDSKHMIAVAKDSIAKMTQDDREAALKKLEDILNSASCGCGDAVAPFQAFLARLGVSHPAIDGFVDLAKEHGVQAKITGAGGGGYMLGMFPKGPMYYLKMVQIRQALKSDPRTRKFQYTLSDLKTTDHGVAVSFKHVK